MANNAPDLSTGIWRTAPTATATAATASKCATPTQPSSPSVTPRPPGVASAAAPARWAPALPPVRACCAARQAATSADGLASACDSGALTEPAGAAAASTLVGLVQGLSGSGNSGFGAAASPGAAESTTAAVVIADRRAVLCVLRARQSDVLAARECISFPHGSQAERVTDTVTSATQVVTRSAQIGAVCP